MTATSWRLFIGCFLQSEALLAAYQQIQHACASFCHAKWVEPENLHFTLIFLGDIPSDRIPELLQRIGALLREYHSPLLVTGVGVFPNWHSPRVLFLRIQNPDKQLWLLHSRLQEALEPLRLTRQERHFVPHLTIARLKSFPSPQQLRKVLSPYSDQVFAQFDGFHPVLVRSILTPNGPLYSVLSPESPE